MSSASCFRIFDAYEDVRSSVVPTLAARVMLRLPRPSDGFLVEQWFALGDLDSAWGDLERNWAFFARPPVGAGQRMILVDDEVVGYLRYRPVDEELYLEPLLTGVLTKQSRRIDVLVGPRERRFVGIGSVALQKVQHEVFTAERSPSLVGVASVHHLSARRAYEKAGYLRQYFFDDERGEPIVACVWLPKS